MENHTDIVQREFRHSEENKLSKTEVKGEVLQV